MKFLCLGIPTFRRNCSSAMSSFVEMCFVIIRVSWLIVLVSEDPFDARTKIDQEAGEPAPARQLHSFFFFVQQKIFTCQPKSIGKLENIIIIKTIWILISFHLGRRSRST